MKSVTTVEELLAQQKACDAAPTLRCRSEVGQNALRLAQLPVARAQLNDATFAASPEGKTLRTDLLQRAIYLKQWSRADTLYNEARQQNTLSAAERRQWFDVLLAGQLDDRIGTAITGDLHRSSVIYYLRDRAGLSWRKSTPPALSQ